MEEVFERGVGILEEFTDDYEVIILDDASTDETGKIAERIRQEHPDRVEVITHEQNRGIAATFETLYLRSSKDYIFDLPADGEYPPEALRDIVPMLPDYDIVVCNRTVKRYTVYRRVVSAAYRWLPRLLFGVELYDPGSTKCRKREVITEIQLTSVGVFSEAERMIRAVRRGLRLGKVDIVPERRLAGEPRGARFGNVVQAVIDLAMLWLRLIVLRQKP